MQPEGSSRERFLLEDGEPAFDHALKLRAKQRLGAVNRAERGPECVRPCPLLLR